MPWGWDCHCPVFWKEEMRPSKFVLGFLGPGRLCRCDPHVHTPLPRTRS